MTSILAVLCVIAGVLIAYAVGCTVIAVVMLTKLVRGDYGDPADLNE